MKQEFIFRKEGNHRLILIFSGWSTDPELYRHIRKDGWDVMVAYDYDKDFRFDKSMLGKYTSIYLYAWSLGVFAACRSLQDVKLAAAFAVNGTRTPVNDINGIPEYIYDGTTDNLSPRNLLKFQRRMFADGLQYDEYKDRMPQGPDIDKLVRQLRAVKEKSQEPQTEKIHWTRVYISVDDCIFPYRNQINSWRGVLNPVILHNSPHFIDLEGIIEETIPDLSKVEMRFKNALSTYDRHARAQRAICVELTRKLASLNPLPRLTTLEIGAGTGLFTRMYGPLLVPREAHFMDLYPTGIFGIAPIESHATADAEEALETTPMTHKWDFILSANTIQWFCDPLRFFDNAYRYLKPGGWLVISTFVQGTLKELDPLRPSPVVYRDKWEIKNELEKLYDHVDVQDTEIQVTFKTAREALMHLKLTGVSPKQRIQVPVSQLLAAIPQNEEGMYYFTYRPLYILARKPF